MFNTGKTVGLAEWIIDDTCLVYSILAVVLQSQSLPMTVLLAMANEGLKGEDAKCRGKFVAAVLHRLSSLLGHAPVRERWINSSLSWEQFVPKEAVEKFIEENVSTGCFFIERTFYCL